MTETTQTFRILGVPVGDFGFFASILVSVALGFMTFFAMTFLSIVGVSIYKGVTHSAITLDVSYKYIALPCGVLMLVTSFVFFMTLWVNRKRRGA